MISIFGPIYPGISFSLENYQVGQPYNMPDTFNHSVSNGSAPILIGAKVQEVFEKKHFYVWTWRRHHPTTSWHIFASFHPFQVPIISLVSLASLKPVYAGSNLKLLVDVAKFTFGSQLSLFQPFRISTVCSIHI